MEERPRALLLKFPGTNCDAETARALRATGFDAEVLPVSALGPGSLAGQRLVVLSGGFSYGDYVMSGRIASLVTSRRLGGELAAFRDQGGYILGICNGFQILAQLGLLPPGSLVRNASGRFQCQWVALENRAPSSPFLRELPDRFELPVAHAEGRFVTADPGQAQSYAESGLAALAYAEEVNGSFARIAGLQDESGRVFGLMPHPERFMHARDHYDPDFAGPGEGQGWGHRFFSGLARSVSGD